MILSLRQIRRRIRSVGNTKKITHAMEMVAAAKLKRLQELLGHSEHYVSELGRILTALVQNEAALSHPMLERREETKSILVFLVTSDTGLCGSYNANIIAQTQQFLADQPREQSIQFVAIGRNGVAYLKRFRKNILKELSVPKPQQIEETISEIAKLVENQFSSRKTDKVVFIYTKAESLGTLRPTATNLLPIVPITFSPLTGENRSGGESFKAPPHPNLPPPTARLAKGGPQGGKEIEYLLEPSPDSILETLLPEFIEAKIGQMVKHALVSEQASRMLAMRQATDNAEEMIDSLTLMRNKARQASITKELIEVISGSRALQK